MSRYRLPNKQTFELFKRGITKSWYFHKVIFERTNWRLFVASRDKSFFNCLFAERRGEGEGKGGTQHGREKKKEKLTKCGSFVAGFVKHSTTCSDNHVRMCVISDCGF